MGCIITLDNTIKERYGSVLGRYDGILLCSDFDGTLCNHKDVSRENCEAIKYFQENGGLFSLASGRFPSILDEMKDYFVPNTYSVHLNGSMIYDYTNKKSVYEGILTEDIFDFSYELLKEIPKIVEVIFYTYDEFLIFEQKRNDYKQFCSELKKPIFKVVYKVLAKDSDFITEQIRKATAGKYNIGRSWVNGIELQSINDSKGLAVNRLRKMLGSRAEKVVCVGDYENDISMLEIADFSYAVDNAVDGVKAVADKITVANTENAIEKIIYEL